ncbi:hypothetical protein [Massilia sp. KIM]|uniref:hypothetical protein n=1 Tax=Massilia sp. KIM TaxID=1955422 RepID=UPI00117C33A6|nr:hypothetical protein [Massilia sp. KIM]
MPIGMDSGRREASLRSTDWHCPHAQARRGFELAFVRAAVGQHDVQSVADLESTPLFPADVRRRLKVREVFGLPVLVENKQRSFLQYVLYFHRQRGKGTRGARSHRTTTADTAWLRISSSDRGSQPDTDGDKQGQEQGTRSGIGRESAFLRERQASIRSEEAS